MIKILIILLVSLIVILVVSVGTLSFQEVPEFTEPISSPAPAPAATQRKTPNYLNGYWVTVDQNGNVYDNFEKIDLSEFERRLKIFSKTRYSYPGSYTNSEGQPVQYTNTVGQAVNLRVDANCPFDDLKKVLMVMNRNDIDFACYKIEEGY